MIKTHLLPGTTAKYIKQLLQLKPKALDIDVAGKVASAVLISEVALSGNILAPAD